MFRHICLIRIIFFEHNRIVFSGVIMECKAYGVLAVQLHEKWWKHGSTETFITMSDWMVYREQSTQH